MNSKKYIWIMLISLGLFLAACGANAEQDRAEEPAAGGEQGSSENALIQPNAVADQSGMVSDGAPVPDHERDPAAIVATARPVAEASNTAERMIIKNGQLSLIVDDPTKAIDQITVLAAEYGGYVISSAVNNSNHDDTPKTAAITIGVNVDQFEAAMNAVRGIGSEVLQDAATGQDVTSEYVDWESRLRSLEATRDRILSFLEQAQNVQEALDINSQLTVVEQQIEEVKGRMNYLEGRAAYSTISINLSEPVPEPTPVDPDEFKWSLRDTLEDAVDVQGGLIRFLLDAGAWVIVVLGPYLLVGAIIFVFVRRRVRRGVSQ